jgi:hypothetical protein
VPNNEDVFILLILLLLLFLGCADTVELWALFILESVLTSVLIRAINRRTGCLDPNVHWQMLWKQGWVIPGLGICRLQSTELFSVDFLRLCFLGFFAIGIRSTLKTK